MVIEVGLHATVAAPTSSRCGIRAGATRHRAVHTRVVGRTALPGEADRNRGGSGGPGSEASPKRTPQAGQPAQCCRLG